MVILKSNVNFSSDNKPLLLDVKTGIFLDLLRIFDD